MRQIGGRTTSDLAGYLLELFTTFSTNRGGSEEKWTRNWSAFCGQSTGYWKAEEGDDWRSNTFINITKMKAMSAFAICSDMVLQGGKIPFMLQESKASIMRREGLPPDAESAVEQGIDDMTSIIEEQCADCKADQQLLRCIMSGAIYGEMLAKMYVHDVQKRDFVAVNMAPQGMQGVPMQPEQQQQYTRFQEVIEDKSAPAWAYVSPWDIFRDLESDDIQGGRGFFHREEVTAWDLRTRARGGLFLPDAVERVIREAQNQSTGRASFSADGARAPGRGDYKSMGCKILYREFWGRVPKSIAKKFEAEMTSEEVLGVDLTTSELNNYEDDGREVEIMAVLADDHVVRYARVDPGQRPLFRAVWEERIDSPDGRGVADNLEDVQLVLNGAVRAFEDNKKLACNVQFAVIKEYLAAPLTFKPGAQIEIPMIAKDVRAALQQIIVADVGESLLNLIRLMERYADAASMIPQITQGVRPEKSADTAYELSQLLENAGKYIGSVIRNIDNGLIEPIISEMYRYNMADPDLTQGKGAYSVQALGFSSFQARVVRQQRLLQVIQLVLGSEALGQDQDIRELFTELLKSMDLDPKQTELSDERKKERGEQASQAQQAALELQESVKDEDHRRAMEMEEVKGQHKIEQIQAKATADAELKGLDAGMRVQSAMGVM